MSGFLKMPNHISNRLTVSGKLTEVDRFYRENKNDEDDQELDFNRSVPIDKNNETSSMSVSVFSILSGKDAGNFRHPLEDNIVKWGTKWNAYSCQETIFEGSENEEVSKVIYRFDTAWSAPFAWIQSVSKKYPDLKFENYWNDEDIPNCGRTVTRSGEQYLTERYSSPNMAFDFYKTHFRDEFNSMIQAIKKDMDFYSDDGESNLDWSKWVEYAKSESDKQTKIEDFVCDNVRKEKRSRETVKDVKDVEEDNETTSVKKQKE